MAENASIISCSRSFEAMELDQTLMWPVHHSEGCWYNEPLQKVEEEGLTQQSNNNTTSAFVSAGGTETSIQLSGLHEEYPSGGDKHKQKGSHVMISTTPMETGRKTENVSTSEDSLVEEVEDVLISMVDGISDVEEGIEEGIRYIIPFETQVNYTTDTPANKMLQGHNVSSTADTKEAAKIMNKTTPEISPKPLKQNLRKHHHRCRGKHHSKKKATKRGKNVVRTTLTNSSSQSDDQMVVKINPQTRPNSSSHSNSIKGITLSNGLRTQ